VNLEIQNWGGFIGQCDNRLWKQTEVQVPPRTPPPGTPPDIAAQMQRPRTRTDPYGEMVGITPGFIKPAPVAWFASHRHNAKGVNEPYAYTYLFAYVIDVPRNATGLTLPSNESVRILAITGSNEQNGLRPAQELVAK
jgi:alpha-mannosidase